MASPTTTTNYSLFSIPAYLMVAMAPHVYSSTLLQTTKPASDSKSKSGNIYNMANPRSSTNSARYSSNISKEAYATFERARAAHNNMLENAAFFVSAILGGLVAHCEAGYMNRMAALYLATRIAYAVTYCKVSQGPWAFLRTFWYVAGNGVLVGLWWTAGNRIMKGEH